MEQSAMGWAAATRKIYSSVMVFGIGSIAAVGLSLLFELTFILLSAAGVKYGMHAFTAASDITDYFWCGFMLVALIGYLFHRFYIGEIIPYASPEDRKGLNAVRTGTLVFAAGLLPTVIPTNIFTGSYMSENYRILLLVVTAIEIVGLFVMYRGFVRLRQSENMSPLAARGFSNACMGVQMLAICYGLSLIFHLIAILFPETFRSVEVYSVLRVINMTVIKAGKIAGMLVLMNGWAKVKGSPSPVPPAAGMNG